jgi:hypothetical protein
MTEIKNISSKTQKILKAGMNLSTDLIATVLWLYAVIKLFIFDIDLYLIEKLGPDSSWLPNYKSVILILFITVAWLSLGNKKFINISLYIVFFPLVLLVWKLPLLLYRIGSWNIVLGIINSVISLFRSFKANFFIFSSTIIASVLIFTNLHPLATTVAICLLGGVILLQYIRALVTSLQPSDIFRLYVNGLSSAREIVAKSFLLSDDIKQIKYHELTSTQQETWKSNLQMSVLLNRLCLFLAMKMKSYQNSGLNFLAYSFNILWLIILTIYIFACINYGLYILDTTSFRIDEAVSFFDFTFYSFNALIFNTIPDIAAASQLAKIILMGEQFLVFVLIVIFITIFVSVRGQKHAQELENVIEDIKAIGTGLELVIRKDYYLNSIDEAIAELTRLKVGLIDFIYKLSKNLQ